MTKITKISRRFRDLFHLHSFRPQSRVCSTRLLQPILLYFQVTESDPYSGDPIENDYYDDDIFEEPSDDEDESESLNDTYPSSDFEPHQIPPAITYRRASSPSVSRSSGTNGRRLPTTTEPSESSIAKPISKSTSSYASNTPRTANSANR